MNEHKTKHDSKNKFDDQMITKLHGWQNQIRLRWNF